MLNKTESARVIAQLQQFGCNEAEAEIYLQSIEMGPASVQEIAHRLKKNRVTVHSAIEQLIEKGFLYETRSGKRRLIVAENPEILSRLLQRKYNELKLIETNVDYTTQLLHSIKNEDLSRPTVKFYEGVEGFKKMLEETLQAKGEVLVFTYVDLFADLIGPDYLEDYYARRAAKNIHTRLIFPTGPFGKKTNQNAPKYKMRIRFLPPQLKWRSGVFSWNDTIAIQSFTEGKITCTLIDNKDIAHFYRHIVYELVWGVAQPITG